MTTAYLDTSALVKLVRSEPESDALRASLETVEHRLTRVLEHSRSADLRAVQRHQQRRTGRPLHPQLDIMLASTAGPADIFLVVRHALERRQVRTGQRCGAAHLAQQPPIDELVHERRDERVERDLDASHRASLLEQRYSAIREAIGRRNARGEHR